MLTFRGALRELHELTTIKHHIFHSNAFYDHYYADATDELHSIGTLLLFLSTVKHFHPPHACTFAIIREFK